MKAWINWATGGYLGRYDEPQEAAATADMTRIVEIEPQTMVNNELVRQVSEATTKEEAMATVEEAGVVIGSVMTAPNPSIFSQLIPTPEQMKNMGRVELKRNFAANAQKMFEIGQQNNDPFLMMIGSQNLFLAQTVMKVKIEDHIKDALEKFAKKAGAACLAAATAVAAAVALAAKKIGELWDKTKPARDKIKQVLQDMAKKIAEVTKPAREAIKAAAKEARIKMEEAGKYIAGKMKAARTAISEKAQAAGAAISKKAHDAGEYLASTQIGKAAAKAARQAGKKMSDLGAKAKIAVAGGIAGAAAKIAASAEKTKEEGQGHFAKKVTAAVKLAGAKKKVAKLRETLKAQGVSLEARQSHPAYAPGAKPKDRSKGK